MTDTFKPGEIVDIAIKGVRVLAQRADGTVVVQCDDNSDGWRMPPQAAIERVTPAEWPPRKGDLWRDREGDLWFAVADDDGDIRLTFSGHETDLPELIVKDYSPLTLAYRIEQVGGAA